MLDYKIETQPVIVGDQPLSHEERLRIAIALRRGGNFLPFFVALVMSAGVAAVTVAVVPTPSLETKPPPPVVVISVTNTNKIQDRIKQDQGRRSAGYW